MSEGATSPSPAGQNLGLGAAGKSNSLNLQKVDNGFIVTETNNYAAPFRKVALDFDSMIEVLEEYFKI
jgi:hypothetical protein